MGFTIICIYAICAGLGMSLKVFFHSPYFLNFVLIDPYVEKISFFT